MVRFCLLAVALLVSCTEAGLRCPAEDANALCAANLDRDTTHTVAWRHSMSEASHTTEEIALEPGKRETRTEGEICARADLVEDGLVELTGPITRFDFIIYPNGGEAESHCVVLDTSGADTGDTAM